MNGIAAMVAQMQRISTQPPARTRLTGDALRAEIKQMAGIGISQRAIAHELGVSRTYVCDVLRAARQGS